MTLSIEAECKPVHFYAAPEPPRAVGEVLQEELSAVRARPAREVKRLKVKSNGQKPWPNWAFEIAETAFRPELRRLYTLAATPGRA